MNQEPIIFYDSSCRLCNFWMKTISRWDKKGVFTLLPLTDSAFSAIEKSNPWLKTVDGIVLHENGRVFVKSEAIFRIINHLPSRYKIIKVFRVFPKSTLDKLYDRIARNRFKLFGKTQTC